MSCPQMPELQYRELAGRLVATSPDGRFPLWGTIELTERCNLDCLPCYIRKPLADKNAQENELSLAEWCELLDQLVDEGCLCLLFTGGEPLARYDFLDIYTHAKKKGLILTLFTNGTLLTPKIADHLAEWSPRMIEVTMYGRTPEVYERVTRVPGSYARFMRGIELLQERGIPFNLKTIVITANRHELWDMKSFAGDLGVAFRFDPLINPGLDGCQIPLDYRISPEQVVQLDREDADRWNGLQRFCDEFIRLPRNSESVYYCAAGINCFHIDAFGRMSVCLMVRESQYDARSGSFHDGWTHFLPSDLARKRRKPTPCQTCELHCLCYQCPGWAKLEKGDAETTVEYLCRVTHLRADALGLDYERKEGLSSHDTREKHRKTALRKAHVEYCQVRGR